MSRIHEALKQASANPDLRSPAPPLPPPPRAEGVFVQMPAAKKNSLPLLLGLAAAVLLLAGLGIGLLLNGGASDHAKLAVTPVVEIASGRPAENAPLQNAAPAPQAERTEATERTERTETAAVSEVTPTATQPEPAPAPDAPAASAASAGETVPAQPVEPAAPAFRLQGIAYHRSAPSALINGRRVGLGEEVSGARVTRIEPSSVTLAVNGRTEVLTLR